MIPIRVHSCHSWFSMLLPPHLSCAFPVWSVAHGTKTTSPAVTDAPLHGFRGGAWSPYFNQQRGAGWEFQGLQDACDMFFHGTGADAKVPGDLAVAEALQKQGQDLALAAAEWGVQVGGFGGLESRGRGSVWLGLVR
jgi:hypothetical protein